MDLSRYTADVLAQPYAKKMHRVIANDAGSYIECWGGWHLDLLDVAIAADAEIKQLQAKLEKAN